MFKKWGLLDIIVEESIFMVVDLVNGVVVVVRFFIWKVENLLSIGFFF